LRRKKLVSQWVKNVNW